MNVLLVTGSTQEAMGRSAVRDSIGWEMGQLGNFTIFSILVFCDVFWDKLGCFVFPLFFLSAAWDPVLSVQHILLCPPILRSQLKLPFSGKRSLPSLLPSGLTVLLTTGSWVTRGPRV